MKLGNLAAIGLIAALAVAQAPAQTVRVGTFHKASTVVASYLSPLWAESLKVKMAEMAAAKAANDSRQVQKLDAWGNAHQETAHQQLTGEAPITNILEALAPALPEIAKKTQVAMIVADLPYADGSVETVDVTETLLDWLKADARTRTIVRGLD
jgi:galactitol-specific phosphotransferase system IIC component